MGENNASAGIPSQQYSVPYISEASNAGNVLPEVGSYWDYFGLPILPSGSYSKYNSLKVSALPFRGLALIYNEWFRNQNVIAPLAIQTGDTNEVLVGEGSSSGGESFAFKASYVRKAAKMADYFTKALPYAQKGAPVTIPLGTTAVVKFENTGGVQIPSGEVFSVNGANTTSAGGTGNVVLRGTNTGSAQARLVADLSSATAATINQLRYAFQLQKLLEKDALYGSRYWEILAAHFGVNAPDASLQRPEYLGGFRQRINVDQVLSTTGYDDTSSTDLGKPGANSVTGSKNSLFTKSFCEHGHLFIVAVCRHDQTYANGVNRMWTRSNRYDFYFPVFANLGAQEIKNKEIFAQGTSSDDNIFGYQEAWAEYRYKPSIATGLLNPNASNSLDYWTLANKFAALPTLGQTFIEQGRDNIQRALATGSSGPDFICDFYFVDIAVRPMPMYSIPGLIDHH